MERKWRFLEPRSLKEESQGEVNTTFSSTFPLRHFQYILGDQEDEKLNRVSQTGERIWGLGGKALWDILAFVRTPESIYSRIKDNGNKPALTNTEMELLISSDPDWTK